MNSDALVNIRNAGIFDMRTNISMECIGVLLLVALSASYPAEARELEISISSLNFWPQDIQANPGDRITWKNKDAVRHEIFFAKNPTNSRTARLRYQLMPGQSLSIIVTRPGDYGYMCRWHGMLGTIHID